MIEPIEKMGSKTPGIDGAGVVAFVDMRRKASGGYGATPRLPATIEDTFEAVAISCDLALLAPGVTLPHAPATDQELHGYLREALGRNWPGLRTTCQLIRTCLVLNIPVDSARALDYVAKHRAEADDLYTDYYTTLIDRAIVGDDASRPPSTPLALPDQPTVREVRMFLTLRNLTQPEHPDQGGLLAWLRRCQNGDGGFGFFPGTTSFIENSHYCLASLARLGGVPDEPTKARQYVLSCQTGRGGFGRSLRAAPFLDATWHALACLRLLS